MSVVALALVALLLLAASAEGEHHDYVIVGSGPAGLQMAYFLDRLGEDYVLLERSAHNAAFFSRFPRHRKLISINKQSTGSEDPDFVLRHDWNSLLTDDANGNFSSGLPTPFNFRNYSQTFFPRADDMVRYLNDFAGVFELNVRVNTSVDRIERTKSPSGANFLLKTSNPAKKGQSRAFTAKVVLMATGLTRPSYPREAAGINNTEGYESFDPTTAAERFAGKRVLILGTGNSAFEIANQIYGVANLVEMCSRHPPKFSWHTHYAGNVRATNAEFLDT